MGKKTKPKFPLRLTKLWDQRTLAVFDAKDKEFIHFHRYEFQDKEEFVGKVETIIEQLNKMNKIERIITKKPREKAGRK